MADICLIELVTIPRDFVSRENSHVQ